MSHFILPSVKRNISWRYPLEGWKFKTFFTESFVLEAARTMIWPFMASKELNWPCRGLKSTSWNPSCRLFLYLLSWLEVSLPVIADDYSLSKNWDDESCLVNIPLFVLHVKGHMTQKLSLLLRQRTFWTIKDYVYVNEDNNPSNLENTN